MKKVFLALGVLFIALFPASKVYAGSLNTYENEVISAAKQIYEYNGVKYQVQDSFINQLVDYLSTDGVDLTAEQRDEVMHTAFSSIPDGISGGYLVPVPGQELPTNVNNNNQTSPSSGSNQGEGSSGKVTTTPTEGNNPDVEASNIPDKIIIHKRALNK